MTRILTTCQRRGYKLTDLGIWEVTEDREHIGYIKDGQPCDPPQYIQLDPNEHERILPVGGTIIEKRFDKVTKNVVQSGNIVEQVAALVEENERLKQQVAELKDRPSGPDVELIDQWRIQFRWYGSANQLEQEWGFDSQQEAEERFQVWVDTFGEKFKDVEIIHYKINKEGL